MDAASVRDKLRAELAGAASQRAWAQAHHVSQAMVSLVLCQRREPSDTILAALGLRRVISYEPL